MKHTIISVLLALVLATNAWGQGISVMDHRPGQLMVLLKQGATVEQLCSDLQAQTSALFLPEKQLSRSMNIWLVRFDTTALDDYTALLMAQRNERVEIAQFNHTGITLRTLPNDSLFNKQWSLLNDGTNGGTGTADIDAEHAWDIATGGITVFGDTIVVAVIDDGMSITHEDLEDNIWTNRAEIPGNNIDDDGNGFVDDIHGWDFYFDDASVPNSSHGSHVAGIIGAKGNNSKGTSGVNWNVKLLPIAGSSTEEAIVVQAYSYALDMRKRYNENNGQEGAYIVATNSSFGVSFKTQEDLPLWCAMYDSLGKVGILSVGATDNIYTNVDTAGDIPSTCPSDYLVVVTNSTEADELYSSAAYGEVNVDLAAPGRQIWGTLSNDLYGTQSGTSMSTPHVAGAIALMYNAACSDLLEYFKDDPAGLALHMKKRLLEDGVQTFVSMNGKVATGGRLDLYKSVFSVSDDSALLCYPNGVDERVQQGMLAKIYPNPANGSVYVESDYSVARVVIADVQGRLVSVITPTSQRFRTDVSTIPAGIYFMVIETVYGTQREKLLIVHD